MTSGWAERYSNIEGHRVGILGVSPCQSGLLNGQSVQQQSEFVLLDQIGILHDPSDFILTESPFCQRLHDFYGPDPGEDSPSWRITGPLAKILIDPSFELIFIFLFQG